MTLAKKIEEALKNELRPEDIKTIIDMAEFLKFKENRNIWNEINEAETEYISEKENIVKGYGDKTFKGKDPITKEDVISICSRALHEKKKYIYPDNPEEMLKFRDKDKISNYARKEVALAVQEGFLDSAKGKFKPQSTMTRAEVAVIINRLIEKLY